MELLGRFTQIINIQCLEQNMAPRVSTNVIFIIVTRVPGYLNQTDF